MGDFPTTQINPTHGTIHSFGPSALLDLLLVRKTTFNSSSAWTTANRAIFIPFTVEQTVTAYQIAVENGATLNGNLDVGIYDLNGNRLVSSGTTAQAGVSVMQSIDITDTVLTPGYYFLAMSTDSTTATYIGSATVGGTGEYLRSLGIQEQLTAFVLPNPATFANPAATTTVVPNICIATVATI